MYLSVDKKITVMINRCTQESFWLHHCWKSVEPETSCYMKSKHYTEKLQLVGGIPPSASSSQTRRNPLQGWMLLHTEDALASQPRWTGTMGYGIKGLICLLPLAANIDIDCLLASTRNHSTMLES